MIEQFKIYTKTVEFIAWFFPIINKFPKAQRFVLGQQIETTGIEVLKAIIRANHQTDLAARKHLLAEVDLQIELLRSLLRVAHLLGFLSHKQYEHALMRVSELGKMLGGWKKQTASA